MFRVMIENQMEKDIKDGMQAGFMYGYMNTFSWLSSRFLMKMSHRVPEMSLK